jgi:hypothetical protein
MSMPLSESDLISTTPLQVHFQQCAFATGATYRLHCMVENIGGFLAPRIVSVLFAVVLLLAGILSMQVGAS